MGELWESGISGGVEKPNIKQIVKKNQSKNLKNWRNQKKFGKSDFFVY